MLRVIKWLTHASFAFLCGLFVPFDPFYVVYEDVQRMRVVVFEGSGIRLLLHVSELSVSS